MLLLKKFVEMSEENYDVSVPCTHPELKKSFPGIFCDFFGLSIIFLTEKFSKKEMKTEKL
jgi:hypothetical protein